ncbi:MAG: virulence factor [Rhodospirillales bacterium]
MAQLTILYWRDIPSQVVVKAGRQNAKRILADRFQEAIDIAAMQSKSHETDDYLAEWRKGDPQPCGDDLEAEAQAAAERIESEYNDARVKELIANAGREAQ